jgi:hypothetical protein
VIFYLGTHHPHWLAHADVPLFVSRRRLAPRRTLPQALAPWALDSGGFSELSLRGEWSLEAPAYAVEVQRFANEIGSLVWAAPQDWMCEPLVRAKTGLTVAEHQRRTVENFVDLRDRLGQLVIPVLQGYEMDDYLRCIERYEQAGVALGDEAVVGVGSVCRRSSTGEAALILRRLAAEGLSLHAFGVKGQAAVWLHEALVSCDSMAWSYNARRSEPLPGCTHKNCANCMRYAMAWRARFLARLDQMALFA